LAATFDFTTLSPCSYLKGLHLFLQHRCSGIDLNLPTHDKEAQAACSPNGNHIAQNTSRSQGQS